MFIIDYNNTDYNRIIGFKSEEKILFVTKGVDDRIDWIMREGDIIVEVDKFNGYGNLYFNLERAVHSYRNTEFIGISDNELFRELMMSLSLTDLCSNTFHMERVD